MKHTLTLPLTVDVEIRHRDVEMFLHDPRTIDAAPWFLSFEPMAPDWWRVVTWDKDHLSRDDQDSQWLGTDFDLTEFAHAVIAAARTRPAIRAWLLDRTVEATLDGGDGDTVLQILAYRERVYDLAADGTAVTTITGTAETASCTRDGQAASSSRKDF